MLEYRLDVTTSPLRGIPARICTLLMPLDIEIVGLRFAAYDTGARRLELTVLAPSARRLELLTKRLDRLVEVLDVVTFERIDRHDNSTENNPSPKGLT